MSFTFCKAFLLNQKYISGAVTLATDLLSCKTVVTSKVVERH